MRGKKAAPRWFPQDLLACARAGQVNGPSIECPETQANKKRERDEKESDSSTELSAQRPAVCQVSVLAQEKTAPNQRLAMATHGARVPSQGFVRLASGGEQGSSSRQWEELVRVARPADIGSSSLVNQRLAGGGRMSVMIERGGGHSEQYKESPREGKGSTMDLNWLTHSQSPLLQYCKDKRSSINSVIATPQCLYHGDTPQSQIASCSVSG